MGVDQRTYSPTLFYLALCKKTRMRYSKVLSSRFIGNNSCNGYLVVIRLKVCELHYQLSENAGASGIYTACCLH